MSSIMVQYVTNKNISKYHIRGIYFIEPVNVQSNTFYGADEGSIFLFEIYIFQIQKYFVKYLKTIKVVFL